MSTRAAQIIDRIRDVYEIRSDADLARHLGVTRATPNGWRRRDTIDFDLIAASFSDLNMDWVIRGRGKPRINEIAVNTVAEDRAVYIPRGDIELPLLGTTLMGDKSAPQVLDRISSFGYQLQDWVEDRGMSNPEKCFLAEVGDSQLTGMLDIGDWMLVERCEEIGRDGIYAFFTQGNFVPRYVMFDEGKLVTIPSYLPFPIRTLDLSDDFRLFGMVKGALTRVYHGSERWNAFEQRALEEMRVKYNNLSKNDASDS